MFTQFYNCSYLCLQKVMQLLLSLKCTTKAKTKIKKSAILEYIYMAVNLYICYMSMNNIINKTKYKN